MILIEFTDGTKDFLVTASTGREADDFARKTGREIQSWRRGNAHNLQQYLLEAMGVK